MQRKISTTLIIKLITSAYAVPNHPQKHQQETWGIKSHIFILFLWHLHFWQNFVSYTPFAQICQGVSKYKTSTSVIYI